MSTDPIRVARYVAGRDLAIQMLREGSDSSLFERAALEARERTDPSAPQDRWVVKYLQKVQSDPTLMDGFSAVLSDYLTSGSGGSPDHYAGVSASMLTKLTNERPR